MTITKAEKSDLMKGYARHGKDTGSPEVQIALLTQRILHLTDHLRTHKHDEHCRRGLLKLVGQRRRLLKYLSKKNYRRYIALTDELNIRRR